MEAYCITWAFLNPYHRVRIESVTHKVTCHEVGVLGGVPACQLTVDVVGTALERTSHSFIIGVGIGLSVQCHCCTWVGVDSHYILLAVALHNHLVAADLVVQGSVRNIGGLTLDALDVGVAVVHLGLHVLVELANNICHFFGRCIVGDSRESGYPFIGNRVFLYPHVAHAYKVARSVQHEVEELLLHQIFVSL